MLAILLFSAFAVYGFYALLLALAELPSDAIALRFKGCETKKELLRRCDLTSGCRRERVIILENEEELSEGILSLGYPVYLRVKERKGERDDGA